jgi:hypothetical protein
MTGRAKAGGAIVARHEKSSAGSLAISTSNLPIFD